MQANAAASGHRIAVVPSRRLVLRYKGDYDTFEHVRYNKVRENSSQREAQDKQKAHMQTFIDKFRYAYR